MQYTQQVGGQLHNVHFKMCKKTFLQFKALTALQEIDYQEAFREFVCAYIEKNKYIFPLSK